MGSDGGHCLDQGAPENAMTMIAKNFSPISHSFFEIRRRQNSFNNNNFRPEVNFEKLSWR